MKIREEYKNTLIFFMVAMALVGMLTIVIILSYYANSIIR